MFPPLQLERLRVCLMLKNIDGFIRVLSIFLQVSSNLTWCDMSAPMCPCPVAKFQPQVPKLNPDTSWHIYDSACSSFGSDSGPRCNAKIRQGCKQRRYPQTCSTRWSKHIKHIRTYLQVAASHNRSSRSISEGAQPCAVKAQLDGMCRNYTLPTCAMNIQYPNAKVE